MRDICRSTLLDCLSVNQNLIYLLRVQHCLAVLGKVLTLCEGLVDHMLHGMLCFLHLDVPHLGIHLRLHELELLLRHVLSFGDIRGPNARFHLWVRLLSVLPLHGSVQKLRMLWLALQVDAAHVERSQQLGILSSVDVCHADFSI